MHAKLEGPTDVQIWARAPKSVEKMASAEEKEKAVVPDGEQAEEKEEEPFSLESTCRVICFVTRLFATDCLLAWSMQS